MAYKTYKNLVYGMGDNLIDLFPEPIVAQRAPGNSDKAPIGQIWIDQPNDDAYMITSIAANVPTWVNIGGGAGVFTTVTTTGSIIAGTTLASGTTCTVGTNLTVSGLGRGVVQSSAAGLFSSSAGTNGQLLVASTGASPVWAAITSATLVITPGAGTLNIEESGGTANSFVTDLGGPVTPLVGVTTIAGGSNITTDGTVANTITFDLNDNVSVAGYLRAGVDFDMLTGTCNIEANDDAAGTIYLHADGGTNETIAIRSEQGTGAGAISLTAVAGGIAIDAALASATAISIDASDAAGGIAIDYGSGGCAFAGTNGAFLVETGTGAINVGTDAVQKAITIGNATGNTSIALNCGTGACNIATSATAHTTTVGSTTGASSLVLQAGSGDLLMTSTDDITIDGAGVVEINSTAGAIGIASDADNFALNLATAGTRTVTLGSATATIAVNCGTSGATFGATANAHTTTIGSVDTTSNTILQSGSTGTAITSTGVIDIDATGAISLNSTAGILSLGNDADNFAVNIATAGERVVTIGNITGASQVVLNSGTAGIQMVSTGAGDITIDSDDTVLIDADGVVEINSSAGIISIGNDADAQNINVGTGAAQRDIVIGNTTGTTSISLDAASGGIDINGAGLVTVTPAVDSQAGAAVTINANVGVATFTGLTTAAAASQVLTITNSVCTAGSAILCSLSALGVNDAQCTITRVIPAVGSFTVTYQNLGAAALNGNLILTFWIIAA